jgi:hypothetical protein
LLHFHGTPFGADATIVDSSGGRLLKSKKTLIAIAIVLIIGAAAAMARLHWRPQDGQSERMELLEVLPGDPTAVCFADFRQLRSSEIFEQWVASVPKQPTDPEYDKFVQATGFHYDRDLDRAAMAVLRENKTASYLIVADGRFDRKKIEAYAQTSGTKKVIEGKTIFALPPTSKSNNGPTFFTFLREDRIALTNDPAYAALLLQKTPAVLPADWRERFTRLAGTPVFVVLREDPSKLPQLAPQALQSPQLATLLSQLQWISVAAKPDGNLLRLILDAESASPQASKQLTEFFNGLIAMATIGLNDAKVRQQMDPKQREAYLEILKTATVDNVDRGDMKSTRVLLELTPSVLQNLKPELPTLNAAPKAETDATPTQQPNSNAGNSTSGKKQKAQSPAAPPRM